MRRYVLIPTILLLAAATARAEEVYLTDGDVFEGNVIEVTDEAVVMSLEGLEGSRVEIPLSRVSDYSHYQLKRARIDPRSAKARMDLGDWAEARGMYSIALEEYRVAKRLMGNSPSPELDEKLSKATAACGGDRFERARELIEESELEEARALLRSIREDYPDCPVADKADELLPGLSDRIKARHERMRRERKETEALSKLDERIGMADDLLARGDRMRHLGYLDSGDLADAEDDFLESIHAYRKAARVLDTVAGMPRADERAEKREALRHAVVRRLTDVYVDVGYNFIVKGNLVRANHYAGRALALDSNSPKALALRRAIAEATAEDVGGLTR